MVSLLAALLSSAALVHTYVIYPWHMRRTSRRPQEFDPLESFPELAVLMAVRNEESVIRSKVISVFRSSYPKARLKFYIGTDACTDQTDSMLQELVLTYTGLKVRRFETRTGKPAIIQALFEDYQKDSTDTNAVVVLTDADTLLEEKTLPELVLPFGDPTVGGVQARIVAWFPRSGDNPAEFSQTVVAPEIQYLEREMITKQGESVQGCVMGGYGALMALRRSEFTPVPVGFIVDDFYWFASILRRGRRVVFAPQAIARMPIEGDASVQFRRKRRLGKGNLQNLWAFRGLVFQRGLAYAFLSHKVIRWLSPWLIITSVGTLGWMLTGDLQGLLWYSLCLGLVIGLLIVAQQQQKNPSVWKNRLGGILHFLHMNLALALGAWDLLRDQWSNQKRQVWWDNHKT